MSKMLSSNEIPYPWIRRELILPNTIKREDKTKHVKYIQEWLCYHGFKTVVDQNFGPATERQVRNFQEANDIQTNGEVDGNTYNALIIPMLKALSPITERYNSFSETFLAYARKHVRLHPIEIGGQNKGPWVRLYMSGHEGRDYPWCAGFVSFLMRQTSNNSSFTMPIKGSWSCDSLVAQAKEANIFISESDIKSGRILKSEIMPGSIFLCRRSSTDWTHTGVVTNFEDEIFETIEGNTNDEGHREGYEACERIRSYTKKDFIRIV